jgi:hypothetical protein
MCHFPQLLAKIGCPELFFLDWPWTVIFLNSVSQVARITGVSLWCLAALHFTMYILIFQNLLHIYTTLPQMTCWMLILYECGHLSLLFSVLLVSLQFLCLYMLQSQNYSIIIITVSNTVFFKEAEREMRDHFIRIHIFYIWFSSFLSTYSKLPSVIISLL